MQLTDEQKQQVAQWVAEGATLAEVQQRLAETWNLRLTYMEARFLIDDLEITLPEKEVEKEATPPEEEEIPDAEAALEAPAAGGVDVSLDKVVRPGALVSGKVTFSDGIKAEWYLDQMGRFGLVPPEPGYRPSPEDMADFKIMLERELSKQGF